LVGVVQVAIGNNTIELFLKIFLGMLLSVSFYYYVMRYYDLDVVKIFRYYLKGAVIASYIGLFQIISFNTGFRPGYDFHWLFNKWGIAFGTFGIRLNSVFSEASQCAIMLSPAAFVAIYSLFRREFGFLTLRQCMVVLLALFLTASSTGYMGILIIAFLFTINYGKFFNFFIGIILALLAGFALYNYVPEFKSRVDTSMGLWMGENFSIENVNSSSFVLYNNYHIATENFKENFLTGTGLGSHEVAFDKYSLTKRADILDIKFNKADANSLFLRLMSETGLIGMIFLVVFLFRNYVRRDPAEENDYWIISNATLVIIMLYLLRQGNYFLNGFPLFMWLYYYCRKASEEAGEAEPVTENAPAETHALAGK
jgi:hypothetical protein